MKADVAVVGAGVMGSATARSLARSGLDVVLLERFRIGHARGSSHGASRIFRFSYDDVEYVRMAMESLPLWRALEDEAGEELVTTIGGLDIGADLDRHAGALEQAGAHFEWVDGGQLRERFPAFSLDGDARALLQPDAGIAHAERAWRAFARSAVEAGAELREETVVDSIEVKGDGIEVRARDDAIEVRTAVVTAGPWARRLLEPLGIEVPLRETRETVAFFRIEDETIPSLVDWRGPPYFFALGSPGQGLKVGWHMAGADSDPDAEEGPSDEIARRISDWVSRHFPSAETPPFHTETCFYTRTPDESFVLRREGPIVIGSACSGHGFKFAPLIGERLAALARDRG